MRTKNIVVFIASLFIGSIFIGADLPSVIAGNISQEKAKSEINNEPCLLCESKFVCKNKDPDCDSCNEAVDFAVEYMKGYVKDKVKGDYFLWRVDVTILIFKGLIEGLKESGFELKIDKNALKANIEYWVNKTVGSQAFTVTLFLAKLGAITIGVTSYLLTLCIDNDSRNVQVKALHIGNTPWIHSRSLFWIILQYVFGLIY
jgi:hypothetical protein